MTVCLFLKTIVEVFLESLCAKYDRMKISIRPVETKLAQAELSLCSMSFYRFLLCLSSATVFKAADLSVRSFYRYGFMLGQ